MLDLNTQSDLDTEVSVSKSFCEDVLHGLKSDPKSLPCKYFYDEKGSELFERICGTQDYYVTRTETVLLQRIVSEIASMLGSGCDILEFGSGAGEKIRLLLDALESPNSYTPMDISEEILLRSASELRQRYPGLSIQPWVGDYTQNLSQNLSQKLDVVKDRFQRVVFFPGSTISNFTPDEAEAFLSRVSHWLGEGGVLLIGVDTVKATEILHAAYNDSEGYTAQFNLNVLHRIKSELHSDIDPDTFSHLAFFNEDKSRIEMHLVSDEKQSVHIQGEQVQFQQGERIHTENSYKYSPSDFEALANKSGFTLTKRWLADQDMYSFYYLTSRG